MSLVSRALPLRQALRSWHLPVIALVATVLLFTVASVALVVLNDGAGRRAAQAEALATAYGELQVALLQVEVARHDLLLEGGLPIELRSLQPVLWRAYERVEELEDAGGHHARGDHAAEVHRLGSSLSDYLAGVSLLVDLKTGRSVDVSEQATDAQVHRMVDEMAAESAEHQESAVLALGQMREQQRFGARVFPILGGLSLLLVGACVRLLSSQRRRLAALRSDAQVRAVTDELTGLANRAGLQAALRARLPVTAPGRLLGLLLLDLDGFKSVNDAFGHGVGDEVLRVVADRLRDTVPDSALVARLGGDEFVVLMGAVDQTEVERMAASISVALSAPTVVRSVLADVRASIGMSITDGSTGLGSTAASELLRCADIAMYAAKKAQRGPVLFSSVPPEQLDEGRPDLLSEVP